MPKIMNKVIVVKDKNYTTVSNVVLRDRRLSLKAKGLLVTILGLPDDWDFTINGITTTVKEGRESVSNAIAELMECGYCDRSNERDDAGHFLGYDYTFFENPSRQIIPADLPDTGNPSTDNPDTGNPIQLSKQESMKQRSKETQEIFDFWKATMSLNGSTLLTPKRKQKIKQRLADGYTIERIKNAIVGCSLSPFHNGQNDTRTKYNDIELICRSGEKVEFFEQKATEATKQTLPQSELDARDAVRAGIEAYGR